jgi:Cdc6-like AAA superfamily ATPase
MAYFKQVCPREFQQKIDRSKIGNLAAWDLADTWTGSHPGIWIWSHDTGEAKSRMLWRKFGELHVNHGKTVMRITGLNLSEAYHDAFFKNHTSEFYGRFGKINVIMLDDLDKMALNDSDGGQRNARMLRELFDRFYEQHKPVMVTSNENIAWFEERAGPSAGRRMKETCKEIEF